MMQGIHYHPKKIQENGQEEGKQHNTIHDHLQPEILELFKVWLHLKLLLQGFHHCNKYRGSVYISHWNICLGEFLFHPENASLRRDASMTLTYH